MSMILRSGWVARGILILLALFSIISWAIIFNRFFFLQTLRKLNRNFSKIFEKMTHIQELKNLDKKYDKCSLGKLYRVGHLEYERIYEEIKNFTDTKERSFFIQNQITMLSERLNIISAVISKTLDNGVYLLGIISSVSPFIGLLGTVWGIMNSFYEIGRQGSASLPVVAPGLAEALITTIIGLAVAIPAVFFYNVFHHQAERIEEEMDEFDDHLLIAIKKELFSLIFYSSNKS